MGLKLPEGKAWRPWLLGAAGIVLALMIIVGAVVASQRASASPQETEVADAGAGGDGEDGGEEEVVIKGDVPVFHHFTVDVAGPEASVSAGVNPFSDYLLEVDFVHAKTNESATVQGYFAADGDAGESGATEGSVWRCVFTPWVVGEWAWTVRFKAGKDVAVGKKGGKAVAPDGKTGDFKVGTKPAGISKRDGRGKGRLRYVGKRYLRFEGSKEWFLSGGTDSPEGLLNYEEFSNTKNGRTRDWKRHVKDWKSGDPTWQDGKGKGIIGVVNYLSSLGLNSVSFLLFSHLGSDGGVFGTVGGVGEVKDRYDVEKLEQWRVVFDHMEKKGLMMQLKLSEVQAVKYWDDGKLGRQRKLYYREMIARFGHYNAIQWNLGEELGNEKEPDEKTGTDYRIEPEQIREYGDYIASIDAMEHPIALHTWPTEPIKKEFYGAVIADKGATAINAFSLQGQSEIIRYYLETKGWVDKSEAAGVPKVVTNDEQGPYQSGIASDERDISHFENRTGVLWPPVFAGGAGHQTYFGFSFPNSDIDVEDMRSYEGWFKQVVVMLDFFPENKVPFQDMVATEELTSNGMYTFYKPGDMYLVQVVSRYATSLDLTKDSSSSGYAISWFDAAKGGAPKAGSVDCAPAGGWAALGTPPGGDWEKRDWIAILKKDASCKEAKGVKCGGAFVRVDGGSTESPLTANVEFTLVDKSGKPLKAGTTIKTETGLCKCGVAQDGAEVMAQEKTRLTLRTEGGAIRMGCEKPWDPSERQCAPSLLELGGEAC